MIIHIDDDTDKIDLDRVHLATSQSISIHLNDVTTMMAGGSLQSVGV